ncbi:MAG: RNHCP domain-containing protein [Patescibacteria group bacterium]|nr:RNHCP domain-containing protein [Patescibacteria group bacterium]
MEKNTGQKITKDKGFDCDFCGKRVSQGLEAGVKNRNHCPDCLFSKHVDAVLPGDRKAVCQGKMPASGLCFKKSAPDKYGKSRQGELMLVHVCQKCGKISLNRLAGDDRTDKIMELVNFRNNGDSELVRKIKKGGVEVLGKEDEERVKRQLFGEKRRKK